MRNPAKEPRCGDVWRVKDGYVLVDYVGTVTVPGKRGALQMMGFTCSDGSSAGDMMPEPRNFIGWLENASAEIFILAEDRPVPWAPTGITPDDAPIETGYMKRSLEWLARIGSS